MLSKLSSTQLLPQFTLTSYIEPGIESRGSHMLGKLSAFASVHTQFTHIKIKLTL